MVQQSRSGKARKKTARRKATSSRAQKPKAAKHGQSKSDFIRAHPNLSASAVVKLGSEKGIRLTEGFVYNVRTTDRTKAKAKAEASSGQASRRATATSASSEPSVEVEFRSIVLRIGLDRAAVLLEEIQDSSGVQAAHSPAPQRKPGRARAPLAA